MKFMSNEIYSPQKFVEIMTGGMCYVINGDDDEKDIHKILTLDGVEDEEYPLLSWPLTEAPLDLDTYVVLVNCMIWSDEYSRYDYVLTVFECGDDFLAKIKNLEEE